jgi:hypothetical protein
MRLSPAFGRRRDRQRGWQYSPQGEKVRALPRHIKSREGSFSRGEKVRMRAFQQSAKNAEMGARELGVTSPPALQ